MNDKYLEKARKQIPDKRALIILVAKRAKQLSEGQRPLIKTNDVEHMDIALLEVAEGLLTYELPDTTGEDSDIL